MINHNDKLNRRALQNAELEALITRAKNAAPMTEAELNLQRQSFVRAMTTPCEHGVLDFEQCAECRRNT